MNTSNAKSDSLDRSKSTSVEYRYSREFPDLLASLDISLVVSTYQAGQVVMIGTQAGELVVDLEPFDRPMGLAYSHQRIAVATRQQVWILVEHDSIAAALDPPGRYQRAFLARHSTWTGDIQAHELAWQADTLLIANTSFSCLCKLDQRFSFVPQWHPPFITSLAAEDRCHLNGIAMADGEPLYVTALAAADTAAGWRPGKLNSGVLLAIPNGEIIASGLCMPHSPRIHRGDVWLLNSGYGQLLLVHPESSICEVVTALPGYTRGLALVGSHAFVGLSKIRESAVFGGVPIAEHHDQLRCAVAIVDLATGKMLANFEFLSGIEEIFDVIAVPTSHATAIRGPTPGDERPTIWVVPN